MNVSFYTLENSQLVTHQLTSDAPESVETLIDICKLITGTYFILKIKPGEVHFSEATMIEWFQDAEANKELIGYSNYHQKSNESEQKIPTIEYGLGSIRDDFNFGALIIIKKAALEAYLNWESNKYIFAALYAFRLFASRQKMPGQTNKYLYSYSEQDLRKSGEKQFDYVDPRNRERQLEMEKAATIHLTELGAKVSPPFREVNFNDYAFKVEASVIIPVLNREKTIADAIQSVLDQQTTFSFNLIIVDNHSKDKTAEIIESFKDSRVIHCIPDETNLGIGGCWNLAVKHPQCGRFAVQLDSDDLYLNENTLECIVDQFYADKCAMVIGSYQMVNFKLEEIPPGIIDHREWTDDNGPNNALRINGLGAPRAFFTPIIREIGFPNVSYGEDYAVGIAISRTWKVGRIYKPIYLCRRWDQNTDSNLSIEKMNAHNVYKDSLRTNEIIKRKDA